MPAAAFEVNNNRLLASLPMQDSERWRSCLEAVALVTGQVLHEARHAARFAYFPIGAVVSMQLPSNDGACDEVALVGHEGMVGISTFMGSVSYLRAVVQRPGPALRMNADRMRAEAESSTAVLRLLLQYVATWEAHIALGVVCNRHHNLQQRLALRLLLGMDRQQDSRLAITHEQLAVLLGVRRESVTEEARRLQNAGLIRYARGRIAVLDPTALAQRSCSCLSLLTGGWQHSEPGDNPATVPTFHASHTQPHREHNGDPDAARAW
ncbi:Crp/Fnr family transcriptional regulator [Ramlibacter ginsenosidimutans]|uniref:Crp/Fnr family transcriptional regulator n=1 Tax=Ramlibacter ginsenosidimutans TaxID=502333 RepID=A0A934WN62_9BURK|nr:Crp/Fnr family transcriptional regulator [Ramlibacter ginsenosidimutans]